MSTLNVAKIEEQIKKYQTCLRITYPPTNYTDSEHLPEKERILRYCALLLDGMQKLIWSGELPKVIQQLSFIQGCLWSFQIIKNEKLNSDIHSL
ncbi:MAG: hypothetical protein UT32_C0027G0007 [Parcubacteria group bacterium GW2011_GWC2_39_14]|nr:MAG: hypothetical protein UT32_C0027G0007 [Parcubacteria group bacterium GW2011_GWC2_39_14]